MKCLPVGLIVRYFTLVNFYFEENHRVFNQKKIVEVSVYGVKSIPVLCVRRQGINIGVLLQLKDRFILKGVRNLLTA